MSDEKSNKNEEKELESGTDALLEGVDEAKELEKQLQKCQQERDEYLAGWKRAKADLANYKREEAERKKTAIKYANEDILRSLLTVLDSFDLALQAMEKQGEVERGVYMIHGQLQDALESHGLEQVATSPGDAFDPRVHEAVATVPSDKHEEDEVVEVVEPGYKLRGKVLRAARVKVASAQGKQNNE